MIYFELIMSSSDSILYLKDIRNNIAFQHNLNVTEFNCCIYNTKYMNSPIYFTDEDMYENDWLMSFKSKLTGKQMLFVINEYL